MTDMPYFASDTASYFLQRNREARARTYRAASEELSAVLVRDQCINICVLRFYAFKCQFLSRKSNFNYC